MTSSSDQKNSVDLKESFTETAKNILSASNEASKKMAQGFNDSVGNIKEDFKDFDRNINPAIDELAAKAQALAERGINFCADSSERARRQIHQASEATTRYVVEQPGKSIFLAAAAGAAVTAALLLGIRRR